LPTAIPQAIPVVKPGQFPHIVAYSATNSRNTEVYLLNPGFEPINITQNPAEDTFPIWSPDGQWLAFLSNRAAPGQEHMKNEIYVMSIAGNHLIQLTSEAMVDWEGPLSWSTDGKWIAASGVLLDNPQERSIYLIGVDGSASYRLSGTQGGSLPKFGPYGDRLAFYQVEENQSRIVIYHVNSGKSTSVDFRPARNNPAAVEVSFDWPGDGDGLYYAAGSQVTNSVHVGSQQPCARMEMQQASNNEAWHEKLHDHFHYVKSEKAAVIQNMSWAPNGLVLYTAGAQDFKSSRYETAENYGFPSNHPRKSNNPNISADLCVLGLLDRGSWSLDMQWFIFTAYERGKTDIGLYIIRMPGLDLGWQPGRTTASPGNDLPIGTVLRLTPASINSSAPRMRPIRRMMGIEPRPSRLDFILKADRLAPFGYALGSAYIPFSPRW
jgi:dipeptidyl aminopeptidase/acylaminoacyl peptidase